MSAITPQDGQGPSDDRAVPLPGRRARWLWAARAVQVRLRFLIALVVAFLVVGRWETIRAYWDRLTAASSNRSDDGAVSPDTEYFCPMDPGVLSDWPNKCPVCHMALVRRKKGDMGPLPSGVLARVQISPDRLMLAGVRTEAVGYRPLDAGSPWWVRWSGGPRPAAGSRRRSGRRRHRGSLRRGRRRSGPTRPTDRPRLRPGSSSSRETPVPGGS